MGLERLVPRDAPLSFPALVERLAGAGMVCAVMMIDGALAAPGTPIADGWRDVRLRTPAGTVTLSRRAGAIAVLVFGNADGALTDAQRLVAETIAAL
jgi:hypothetical protein